MRAWRSKLVFMLIVYFAGFATAIYSLAPAPEKQAGSADKRILSSVTFKSDEFAKSFNKGMHKCIELGKDYAWRAGKFMKQKLDEKGVRS